MNFTTEPRSIKTVMGDGGYDTKRCRKAAHNLGAQELIPPRRNSKISRDLERRSQALLEIRGLGGDNLARGIWGKLTGYSTRALVETSFSRMKRLYEERFYSKKMETQRVEGLIKCKMLNQMLARTS